MSIAVSSNFNYVAVGGDEESKVVASNVSERIRRQHEALQTIGNDPHATFTQLAQEATQSSSTVLTPTHTRQRSTTSGGSGQYPPHHFEKTPQHLHAALNRQESMDRGEYKEPTSPQHKPHARPLCSGWLYMQKNTGKWKRLWCEYVHAELTYRTEETARKPKGTIRVAYCESEYSARTIANHVNAASGGVHIAHTGSGSSVLSTSPTKESTLSPATNTGTSATTATSSTTTTTIATSSATTITSSPSPATTAAQRETSGNMAALLAGVLGGNANGGSGFPAAKYDDLYWSYLESQDAQHAFQIYAPGRVYLFRAETEELCTTFVNTIRNELKSVCEPTLWKEKEAAFVEFSPLVREQFILQVNRFNALVKSLSKSGFVEDDLPITSTRKEKSGVLCMETPTDFTKWRDYYFVLFEGALFYYKDSKSTTPTGFITLRFASIQIDPKRLARGEYVLNVKTPLRTVVCRTKHAVALSVL